MPSRRSAILTLAAGVVLLALGLGLIGWGAVPRLARGSTDLPAGSAYYAAVGWGVSGSGPVQGNFQVVNGTPISLYDVDAVNYERFRTGQILSNIDGLDGVNGTPSVDVSGFGEFYVVVTHGPMESGAAQLVVLDLVLSGEVTGFLVWGLLVEAIGAGVAIVGGFRIRALNASP